LDQSFQFVSHEQFPGTSLAATLVYINIAQISLSF
jgi:hypothetical protein